MCSNLKYKIKLSFLCICTFCNTEYLTHPLCYIYIYIYLLCMIKFKLSATFMVEINVRRCKTFSLVQNISYVDNNRGGFRGEHPVRAP